MVEDRRRSHNLYLTITTRLVSLYFRNLYLQAGSVEAVLVPECHQEYGFFIAKPDATGHVSVGLDIMSGYHIWRPVRGA